MQCACYILYKEGGKNTEVLHMIYLQFMCNTSVCSLVPCKIFNMQMAYAHLLYFITDATVDLLTNNLKS
jgi:hypothetical protein